MNADLDALIRLQLAESNFRRAEADLAAVPVARAALDGRLATEKERLDAAKAALDACQKARREHEGALQGLEVKRSKYKGQLTDVKTNKEYTALLHEIEAVEREIRSREDRVLEEMERAEGLVERMKSEEASFAKDAAEVRAEGKLLDERARSLETTLKQLTEERDVVAAGVPRDRLELFRRVSRARGDAVAEAKDGMCTACHVRLRLQMYVELKRNDEVTQCPSCSRVLYYEPAPPVVAPPL